MKQDRNFRTGVIALTLLATAQVISLEEDDALPFVYVGPELPGIAQPTEPELSGGIEGQPAPDQSPATPWISSPPNLSGRSATVSRTPTRR